MPKRQTRAKYLRQFNIRQQEKALTTALDIRKFEIELYWKRGTYFWAFIAAAFAGYFLVTSKSDYDFVNAYVLSVLGFCFSISWYFVNRGSAAWQRNWEAHVDLLEDNIMGPLHKTIINRRGYKFWNLADGYAFSPSRISNLLSLLVSLAWLAIIVRTLHRSSFLTGDKPHLAVGFAALPLLIGFAMFIWGRTVTIDGQREINFRTRQYK